MHYDRGCHCTEALLLTDYLKSLLTGNLLPDEERAIALAKNPGDITFVGVDGTGGDGATGEPFENERPRLRPCGRHLKWR